MHPQRVLHRLQRHCQNVYVTRFEQRQIVDERGAACVIKSIAKNDDAGLVCIDEHPHRAFDCGEDIGAFACEPCVGSERRLCGF